MKKLLPCLAVIAALGIAPAPAGAAGSAVSAGLAGVRWNPCQAVTYSITGHGYAGSADDVRRAARTMARDSGIRLVEVHRPDADISMRWTTPTTNPFLRGNVVGATSTMSIEHDGVNETTGGWIDFDRTAHLRHGFPAYGRPAWGQVFLHELGHALGLSHVPGRDQIMNARISSANHKLGRGDLARLRRIGRSAGCVPSSAR
jgi:hypothetical protein